MNLKICLQPCNLSYFIIPVDSTNLKNFQRKFFLAKVNGLTIGNFLAPERRAGQQAQYVFMDRKFLPLLSALLNLFKLVCHQLPGTLHTRPHTC